MHLFLWYRCKNVFASSFFHPSLYLIFCFLLSNECQRMWNVLSVGRGCFEKAWQYWSVMVCKCKYIFCWLKHIVARFESFIFFLLLLREKKGKVRMEDEKKYENSSCLDSVLTNKLDFFFSHNHSLALLKMCFVRDILVLAAKLPYIKFHPYNPYIVSKRIKSSLKSSKSTNKICLSAMFSFTKNKKRRKMPNRWRSTVSHSWSAKNLKHNQPNIE